MTLNTSYGSLNSLSMMSGNDWDQKNFLEQSSYTVGAAVVDMGVQIVNSVANVVTLGGFEDIQTRSILQDMGADGAVAAYDNNRDAVELMSFVGGMFIPGMAAVKLSRGIRAGLKGTNFLSPMRHKDDLLRFESLIKGAKQHTEEFKQLKRSMFLRGQAENLMDNVAAEFAILGTFNAHPYMEDYLEDPAGNFTLSMALGTGIGGAISGLMSHVEMKGIQSAVTNAAQDTVLGNTRMFRLSGEDSVASMVSLDIGIKNLDQLANSTTASQLEREMAKNQANAYRKTLDDVFDRAFVGELGKLKETDQAAYEQLRTEVMKPEFLGAEKINFFTPGKKDKPTGMFAKAKEAIFTKLNAETAEREFQRKTVYNPELGAFVDPKDAAALSSAADITTPNGIKESTKLKTSRRSKNDFEDIELLGKGGEAEKAYLAEAVYFKGLQVGDLANTSLIDGDLPGMIGWASAVKEKTAEINAKLSQLNAQWGEAGADLKKLKTEADALLKDLDTLSSAKLRIAKSDPYKLIDITEVTELPTSGTNPTEIVKSTYFQDIDNEFKSGGIKPLVSSKWGDGRDQFALAARVSNKFYEFMATFTGKKLITADALFKEVSANDQIKAAKAFVQTDYFKSAAKGMIEDGPLSDTAQLMLMRWIGGNFTDKEIFRTAMSSARTLRRGVPSNTLYHDELTEILNHPRTLQSKEALARHANKNGDIFIYRGLETKVAGDTTVSSYTFHPRIADNFGDTHLFRINKDDVLTYLYDREQEWLVGAATRDYADASGVKKASEGLGIIKSKFGQNTYSAEDAAAAPMFIKEGMAKPDVAFNTVDEVIEYAEWQASTKYIEAIQKGTPREIAAMIYNINPEFRDFMISPNMQSVVLEQAKKGNMTSSLLRWTSANQVAEATSVGRRQLTLFASRQKHMGEAGALLEKQRQHIKDLSAIQKVEAASAFTGPVQPKVLQTTPTAMARDLGLTNGNNRVASDAEIAGKMAEKGYTTLQMGKTKIQFSATEKGVLEKITDTEAGKRIGQKISIVDNMMYQLHNEFLDSTILTSRSEFAKMLYNEVYNSESMKLIREGLKVVNNATSGNPLYQSGDFVTSRMGDVGKAILATGDMRQQVSNKLWQKLATPIANELKKIASDDVARTEFAYFDNIRQSHKGFIRYDAAQQTFVAAPKGAQYDRATKQFFTIVKDAQGKKVKQVVKGEPITEFTVNSPIVNRALNSLQDAGDELYEMESTLRRMKGAAAPSDIGFWMPSVNYVNQSRRYVQDKDTGIITMIVGKTDEEADGLVEDFIKDGKIVRNPREMDDYLKRNGDDGLEIVKVGDVNKQKKGIGLAVPDTDPQRINDIMGGIQSRINAQASNFVELSMYDVVGKLDALSYMNRASSDPKNAQGFQKAVKQMATKDSAQDMKAYLTGHSQIGGHEFMGYVNKAVATTIHYATQATTKAWQMVAPSTGTKVDYAAYERALAAQGVPNPYAVFQEAARPRIYEKYKLSIGNVNPDRVVNASNNLAATMALRFGELAQPLVNMLSMPILMTSTISRTLKASALNTPDGMFRNGPLSIMMGGVRRMNSSDPRMVSLVKKATAEGLLDVQLSEIDDLMRQATFATGGALGKLESALDSNFVNFMSKPAELAEKLVRKTAFSVGVETAIRTYGPGMTETQIMIFARDFMKQALGNYSTAQRPMMFQGTAGAAMGLFQTYMLTYAQNMYRHLEIGDYKGLGKTMLAQAGIFGAGSLPGFQAISQTIGENFSDDNIDLTTGLYRALPDPVADIIVYGLPSTIAPAVHTRGDVNPRIPTGFTTLVAPSMIAQLSQSMINVGNAIIDQDMPAGQAFFEALSTQSVSRPIARMSELLSGYSVTGAGNQIAGPEEIYSWNSALARVFSTRPLAEAKAREAIHLNSYYGSLQREDRQAVMEAVRSHIRNDSLTSDVLDDLAYQYLRTGSPQGFRQAVNQAMMENSNDKIIDLHSKLGDSALMYMLDDIE